MVILKLPVPPSINEAYGNRRNRPGQKQGRGRYKTKKYLQWLKAADWEIWQHPPRRHTGKLEIQIYLPRIRGDISNRIKVVEDYLVSREITGDDRHNRKVSVEINPSLDCCEVRIIPYGG